MATDLSKRLAEIEQRLALYSRAARLDQAKEGSINQQFLGVDVPWLIEELRTRDKFRRLAEVK